MLTSSPTLVASKVEVVISSGASVCLVVPVDASANVPAVAVFAVMPSLPAICCVVTSGPNSTSLASGIVGVVLANLSALSLGVSGVGGGVLSSLPPSSVPPSSVPPSSVPPSSVPPPFCDQPPLSRSYDQPSAIAS